MEVFTMLHLTTALDPSSCTPLYEQLYQSLITEMRTGTLPAGTRMPGKRSLAAELSVSVNTVDAAYQLLTAEGYLDSRARSGFYVQEYLTLPGRTENTPPVESPKPQTPAAIPAAPSIQFDLSTGGVDTSLFPFRTWGRLQKELLYSSPELLMHGDAQGDENLRVALAQYLEEYRGVRCGAHQIVVGAGLEYLLSLLAPLLHGVAALENPGYSRARRVLENSGVVCRTIPVDEGGLSVQALSATDATLCYVTPSHQFPTGVTMPAPRRAELLHWAAQKPRERYIIEDDYDSEFRFDTRPLPSLQGMAGADGPVIYFSTCSRSLAPGIRIAYMVLPEHLLPVWRRAYGSYANTVSRFEQQTLARFITEGYFSRHLARERVAYKTRRTLLASALNEAFSPDSIRLRGLHTGLHLLMQLQTPNAPSDTVLAQFARDEGIRLAPLSAYYTPDAQTPCPPSTLVLGYGALADSLCVPLASALNKACADACASSSGR
jgi:GntR family transcriptional regulator/MocR family aminotransferase